MIKVLLFGRLSELHDEAELNVDWNEELTNLRTLAKQISASHGQLNREFENPQLLISVNQTLVDWDYHLGDGDEVAFLPPVTGG
jgi:molybdopterin synthase sulfur carrier subunit